MCAVEFDGRRIGTVLDAAACLLIAIRHVVAKADDKILARFEHGVLQGNAIVFLPIGAVNQYEFRTE